MRLDLDAAIETHIPAEHEYMRTFLNYQEQEALLGTERVLVVLRARQCDNKQQGETLRELADKPG